MSGATTDAFNAIAEASRRDILVELRRAKPASASSSSGCTSAWPRSRSTSGCCAASISCGAAPWAAPRVWSARISGPSMTGCAPSSSCGTSGSIASTTCSASFKLDDFRNHREGTNPWRRRAPRVGNGDHAVPISRSASAHVRRAGGIGIPRLGDTIARSPLVQRRNRRW